MVGTKRLQCFSNTEISEKLRLMELFYKSSSSYKTQKVRCEESMRQGEKKQGNVETGS